MGSSGAELGVGGARAAQLALGLAAVAAAGPALAELVATWARLGSWAHPGAALAAAALAAWRLRARDEAGRWPTLATLLAFGAGLALLALGALSGAWPLAWFGLPPLALGAAGLLGGERLPARLWPAALLALLALPHPNAPTYALIGAGKTAVGQAATVLLGLCGQPATLDGWVLRLGSRELHLVDACSGLRAQGALLAVGATLVVWRMRSGAARLATLLACAPAAFVASTLRVAALALLRTVPSLDGLAGPLHDLSGALVIVPAVLLVFASGRAVDLLQDEAGRGAPATPAAPLRAQRGPRPAGALLAGAGLAALAALSPLRGRAECPAEPPRLPRALAGPGGALDGRPSPDEPALARSLRPAAIEGREYGANEHERAIAFAIHGHDLTLPYGVFEHAPEVCHHVAGWTTVSAERLALAGGEVLRLELARGERRRLTHVAYLAPGRAPSGSLLGAWARAVADGLRGRSVAATALILSSGDLTRVTDALRTRDARRMGALLRALEVRRP